MSAGRKHSVPATATPNEGLRITTDDGVSLAATFRPGATSASPAVLLLHGVGASRAAVAGNASWLAGLGYATLAIDFRGHGESTLTRRSFGLREASDAAAAFAWLKRRQPGAPVAIIGISMGGAAALLGPKGPLPADALVLQAVYPDLRHAIRNRLTTFVGSWIAAVVEPLLSFQSHPRFGVQPSALSPISALARYGGPVLVIGGLSDRYTPPAESRAMVNAAMWHAELWLRPAGGHLEVCNAHDREYRKVVAEFLARAIRYSKTAPDDGKSGPPPMRPSRLTP